MIDTFIETVGAEYCTHNVGYNTPSETSLPSTCDKTEYRKRISLHYLKVNEIARLEELIKKLGYANTDYRFNYFGTHDIELIVINQDLHRDMKIIRRTKYKKVKQTTSPHKRGETPGIVVIDDCGFIKEEDKV